MLLSLRPTGRKSGLEAQAWLADDGLLGDGNDLISTGGLQHDAGPSLQRVPVQDLRAYCVPVLSWFVRYSTGWLYGNNSPTITSSQFANKPSRFRFRCRCVHPHWGSSPTLVHPAPSSTWPTTMSSLSKLSSTRKVNSCRSCCPATTWIWTRIRVLFCPSSSAYIVINAIVKMSVW